MVSYHITFISETHKIRITIRVKFVRNEICVVGINK